MKFPTILGLIVLIALITGGVVFLVYNQQQVKQQQLLLTPIDIQVVNITDSEATITWLTNEGTYGQVLYGEGSLSQTIPQDDRGNQKFYTHFITIKDLQPSVTYSFKVKDNDLVYPENSPLEFRTSSQKSTNEPSLLNSKQPISAAVLENSESPATDALVFLEINGAAPLATYTTPNGVFILPLKELRKNDLQSFYNLTSSQPGKLLIKDRNKQSVVNLTVPISTAPLPALLIGQNVDLTEYLASPSAQIPKLSFDDNSPKFINKYDLNNDQRVNSLDLATVVNNLGKTNFNQKSDLNSDGKVDQADVDIIRNQLH